MNRFMFALVVINLLLAGLALADTKAKPRAAPAKIESLEGDEPALSANAIPEERYSRQLASGDNEEDIAHFHNLTRRLGVDLGLMVPFGDFQKDFNLAPMIGLHFQWEAIPPWSFVVSMNRGSSTYKSNPGTGKLAVTSITMGAQASFSSKRFVPFLKFGPAVYFNDVSFDATKTVSGGNDSVVSTFGIELGIGGDFVVGREVSLGITATFHYPVPKKLRLSNGSDFNIGSPYANVGLRLNF